MGQHTATARASDLAQVYGTFRAAADWLTSDGYRYDRERLAWLHEWRRPARIERREGERRGRSGPREPTTYVIITLPHPAGTAPPARF